MLEVRRLQIFAAVAEHGSFSAAAESLFMTHSAVSQQVALLERQLGLALVTRGPRGVELTEAGRLLVERGTAVLGVLAATERELQDLTSRHESVRLGVFPTAGAVLVPRAVRAYRERYPEVRIVLRSAHAADMPAALRDGSVQLGVVWDYDFLPRGVPADLDRLHLADDPLCVLVPPDHPLAAEPAVALPDLAGETWVVRGHQPPYDEAFRTLCRLAGFEPRVEFVTEDYPSAQGLVAAGIGISAVPRLALDGRTDVVALPLSEATPHRRIAAVRLRDAPLPAPAHHMLDALRHATTPT